MLLHFSYDQEVRAISTRIQQFVQQAIPKANLFNLFLVRKNWRGGLLFKIDTLWLLIILLHYSSKVRWRPKVATFRKKV